ncbi:glycosyltransferase [Rhodospirillaceae bacterium KN72]|uniref:Glycosyltransferase n=1 Tax=Pacificispira spongiicola TaxID=2729598 RepID=A0A7Y0DX23_9PROT|nr:glycosyltransferase [Pacificispira spongiicola]NMM43068.1 glycosyltransferase [Pacificispira spongiicola]
MADETVSVLHVIVDLEVGGAERALVNLVTSEKDPGIRHHVMCLRIGGAFSDQVRDSGVPLIVAGGEGLRAAPHWIGSIRRQIRTLQPDIVHGWMYYANLFCFAALRFPWPIGVDRYPKLVWGIRCSDMDMDRYPPNLRRAIRLGALCSRGVDSIIANSFAGLGVHVNAGYASRKFGVIPNGFNADLFRPDSETRSTARIEDFKVGPDDVVALTVARVDPMKDFASLTAAARISKKARFYAAGLGTDALPEQTALKGLGRRSDVARLLNGADILVSSSAYGEGMSNSIGEAMACGIPVVATDVGDAARMLTDGEDHEPAGIVVPRRDPTAIANAVERLAADRSMREAMGKAGRQRILDLYSLSTCHDQYARLYRSLVS